MNRTLAIIKPDGVKKNVIGGIISKIEQDDFKIIAMEIHRLSEAAAEAFYAVHKERPFFQELVSFMSSGPCVPLVLEKPNAVLAFRKLIGATDPNEADEGTIRKLFASSKAQNVIHGSDSDENAKTEINFFFSQEKLI